MFGRVLCLLVVVPFIDRGELHVQELGQVLHFRFAPAGISGEFIEQQRLLELGELLASNLETVSLPWFSHRTGGVLLTASLGNTSISYFGTTRKFS